MKNVLITGGTGFIGSNLAAELVRRGANVTILRRENSDLRAIKGIKVKHRIGDILNLESLREAMKGCDTVFHTAAIVSFKRGIREEQFRVNVIGTQNVVAAAIASGIQKLVHTSSIAAIGYCPEDKLATEETPFNWPATTGYKFTKHLAEREVFKGVRRGLWAAVVNPTVVIGERDIHLHGGQLVRDVKKGRVPFYIEGGMNIVYVQDVVRGHISAAEIGRSGERYILGGENLTHKEIFQRTATLVGGRKPIGKLSIPLLRVAATVIEKGCILIGAEPPITPDLVSGAGKKIWFSSEKAERELGFQRTPFDQTILAAYRWYKENGFL
ncbi:MAG: SDR family oxidoreductase [Ignavibacteriae bacterium]|nr:SDR family oxidoreductase [Ignavibacteriota bacterium]